nr:serine/threonine-protein kinase pim-2-like [Chrysemys picta bellii]
MWGCCGLEGWPGLLRTQLVLILVSCAYLPAGKDKEPLEKLYQVGPLLGFGSVYSGTHLSDGTPVAIKHVARDRISDWGELSEICILWLNLQSNKIHGDIDQFYCLDICCIPA